jgi:hypothetical protein
VQFELEVFNFKGAGGIALELFNQWNSLRACPLSMCISSSLVPGSDENHITLTWCHMYLRMKEGMCGLATTLLETCNVVSLLKVVI